MKKKRDDLKYESDNVDNIEIQNLKFVIRVAIVGMLIVFVLEVISHQNYSGILCIISSTAAANEWYCYKQKKEPRNIISAIILILICVYFITKFIKYTIGSLT